MIKIRLSRGGVRNHPFYRIVAIEDKKAPKGKFLDIVGYWHPEKKNLRLDKKIMEKWTKVGAKISPAVEKLINGNKEEKKDTQEKKEKQVKQDKKE